MGSAHILQRQHEHLTVLLARFRQTACHCSADFNNDGDPATDADIEAFFACLAGNCCATCGSAGL